MMKMLITLDEDKISEEGKYDLVKIHAYLENAFSKRGMSKDKDGWYKDGNFTTCGSLIIKLSQTDWFMNNVREWLWYDTSDSSTDDLKAFYLKSGRRPHPQPRQGGDEYHKLQK